MPIKKMAVFVEGQTEVIFVKRLLEELASKNSLTIIESPSTVIDFSTLRITLADSIKYFVLIVDCGNDDSVKSRILDNRSTLIKSGYDLALGLRDLYPFSRSELPLVARQLRTGVPTKDFNIQICLAVMETEAWFIQEENHYSNIDRKLTINMIATNTGFNPVTDSAESIDHPAEFLGKIYRLVGKGYSKSRRHVERTVDAIDYANLYMICRNKLGYFDKFLTHIESFIT